MTATEPQRPEADFRRLAEHSLELLQSAPDAIVVVDRRGNIVLANTRTEEVFGYSQSELVGRPVEMLVPGRFQHEHEKHRAEYVAAPRVRPMGAVTDLIGRRKDGSEFPVEIGLSPIQSRGGMLVVSAIRDITARKEAERRLRDEKRFSDAVIDSLPGLFCMLDGQGRYVRWNRNTERVLGYSAAELAQRTRADVICPVDLPRVERTVAKAFASGEASCDYCNVTKSGRLIPFLCHGVTVEIHGARYLLCIEMDMSEQRRMEQALRESNERYRVVAETATEAIITIGADRRIVYANPATVELFGYALDELNNQPLARLIPGPAAEQRLGELEKAAAGAGHDGPRRGLEMTGRHHSGRMFPIEVSFGILRRADGTNLVTGIIRDISDRVRAAMELEWHRQELAHATRVTMMGEMAAGLAHEVNQPLAAIAAYAQGAAVRLKTGKANFKELATVVERIAEDAHRAGEVIRRLRQFVKKRETERTAVDANELVHEVCRFVAPEAARREMTIELQLAADLPTIHVDPIEIQQVLLNLVRNAFDAVAALAANKRLVVVRTRGGGPNAVEIGVDDTGPGISMNLKEQVFEPFFTSRSEGLGMGLAISRSLVEAHGGRIWTEDSPLGGASVRLTLPVGNGED